MQIEEENKVEGFLEENRKVVQFEIDHHEQIRSESKLEQKDYNLVLT